MNPIKFIDKIKEMYNDQDPRYAKAEFSPVFDPDLEQSEFLRPGETLETWEPNPFLKPHAEGGRAGYNDGQLVRNTVDGSRPGYNGKDQLRTSGGTYKKMYSMEEIRKLGKELNVSEYNKDGIKLTSDEYRDGVNKAKSRFNFYKNQFDSFSSKKKKAYMIDFNKQLVKHKEGGYYISSEKRMPNAKFVKKYFPNATGGSKIVTSINGMLLKNFVNKGNVIKTSPKADANAIRIEDLKKITDPTWETSTGVQGTKGLTLQHVASKNQMVKLNNLSYLKKKLNSSMSQNDKRIKIIENEVDRLLKTKPKNYVQRINALNTEGMALASGYIKKDGKIVKGPTAGYSEFRVKDPLNGKLSYFGKDESKMLLPDRDPHLIQENADLIDKPIKDMTPKEKKRARQIAIDKQKDFKTYLKNSNKKTAAQAQAKLFEKMGIKIADMCSNLVAGGGRIGFATKVCGTALAQRNPDQFLILSEQKMNESFEFKGTKYNSFNEFAKTKPGLWKNLTRSAAKFGRYAASPTTLLGGEIWYTVLDTMASMDKGIKWNEALDNAFFLYDFDQGKKNMFAKGKELGWSDAQIQDATQVFDLAKNQMNIEKTEQKINTLGQWKEDKSVAPFGISAGMGLQSDPDIEGDIERTKIYLSSLQKKQDDAWSNYQSGKTEEQMEKGFGLPYKLGEELRREELIKARDEDKEKVRPLMSDVWNIFPSIWSPIDTIKEKYKLQGVSGFLPGGDKELREKAKAQGISPWLFGMSAADLAEYNKERGFRTKEELKEGPLTSKEMEDIKGRNKWLSYLYQPQASGGRAGYMGGGIAGIRKPHAIPPEKQGLRSIMIGDMDD